MTTKLKGDLNSGMIYAIYGSTSEFGRENTPIQLTPKTIKPKYEGRAVYELFRGAGIRIYPIATDLDKIGNDKTYRSLSELPEHVDVVISCLGKDKALKVVREAAEAGIRHIFFQPRTDSSEATSFCETKGLEVTKGCALSR